MISTNKTNDNPLKGLLKIHSKDFTRLQKILDFIFIFTSFNLIVIPKISSQEIANKAQLAILFLIFLFTEVSNIYKSLRKKNFTSVFLQVLKSWLIFITSLLFLSYLTYTSNFFPRSSIIIWTSLVLIILCFDHLFLRLLLRKYREKGGNTRTILFWGNIYGIHKFENEINKNKWMGYKVVGWCGPKSDLNNNLKVKTTYLGNREKMREWLAKEKVDEIIFSDFPSEDQDSLNNFIHFLGDHPIPIRYTPSWGNSSMGFQSEYIGEQILLNLWGSRLSYIDKKLKRIFDVIFSLIFIFVSSPILLVTYFSIKLTSSKKVFYSQERNGLNGKKFQIFKFRTMHVSDKGDSINLIQTTKDDPRVTRIGKFLRKWSIDELPQLFNVLAGDMSIVGPRPHAIIHNEIYRKKISGYMQRHGFKPGITGLAQIEGWRGETKEINLMEKRINADLRYMNNWNIFIDLKILFYTFFKIKSKKAY